MKVTIAYTDYCLPDYFRGDHRPWVAIWSSEAGMTSKQLRKAIVSEFAQGSVGGNDPITQEYLQDEKLQIQAEKFYSKALPACLNRDIKYRGKRVKLDKKDDPDGECLLHIIFNVEY